MPSTMTIDTSRVVKLLAAKFDFDAAEAGEFLIAAGKPATARTARTDRTDFLVDLAIAESKDEAKAKVKKPPLSAAEKEAKKAAREAKKATCSSARTYVRRSRRRWRMSWMRARS